MNQSDAMELSLFRWMVEMRLYVQESAFFNCPHGKKWACVDVDGEVIGSGETAVKAIAAAQEFIENPTDEEHAMRQRRRLDERDIDRADHLRDEHKDGVR